MESTGRNDFPPVNTSANLPDFLFIPAKAGAIYDKGGAW